jgi:hypothetical protein
MAGKKGRSGRKKNQGTRRPSNPSSGLTAKGKSMLQEVRTVIIGESQPTHPRISLAEDPEASPTVTSSKTNSEFEQTASRLESEYGGAAAPDSPEVPTGEVIPPNGGPGQIVSSETMRRILKGIFSGLEKAHGEQWHVDESDLDMLEPFNTNALTELVTKVPWLAESEYKATMAWALVMSIFIASRSKAGAQLIEKITEAVGRVFTRGATTKPASPESSDSSHPQDTAKPS